MFFAHQDIIWALSQDLKNPGSFDDVFRKLVLNNDDPDRKRPDPDSPILFKNFLTKEMPPAEKADRIVERLARMARNNGMEIGDFYWWDIRSGVRAIKATLVRNNQTMAIYFFWKKVKKADKKSLSSNTPYAETIHDPSEPGGLAVRIEASSYQTMRCRYREWLHTPFTPPT